MILREGKWFLLAICMLTLMKGVTLQGARTYDTSEWIPITPSSLEASSSEVVEQKTASDRVLSLDAPSQKFYRDEEYEYRKRRPNEVQQFLRESPSKKVFEHPRPRNLKHPPEYKFETPPPPPSEGRPQINYYNGQNISPQPQLTSRPQQHYYMPLQQVPIQRPTTADSYVAVPSINPQVPPLNAPNHYDQYQLPFNVSFYQSLNPSSINDDLYQAINNNTQNIQISTRHNQQPSPSVEQETVQLVYVPVENLKANQQNTYQHVDDPRQIYAKQISPSRVNQEESLTYKPTEQTRQEQLAYDIPSLPQEREFLFPQLNKQTRLQNIQQDFAQQALQAHKLQQQLSDDINPLKQEAISSTGRSKQRAHQPPLAVFLGSQKKAEVSDVLSILRGVKTISVQDKVTPDSPQIFIGPSNLDSPDGYTKFPLPYLNNINGNRIERKIDQLPFFVAPVSYKAPPGYSKIALPSPHVGSVVVSVPVTSATPEPELPSQSQLNPFGYSTSEYSPVDPPRQQQNTPNSYNILSPGRNRYESTTIPLITQTPVTLPTRNAYKTAFRQPEVYSTQQDSNQQSATVDVYRPQILQKQRHPARDELRQVTSTTTNSPKQEYTESLIQQSYQSNLPTLDIYRPQTSYSIPVEDSRIPSSTVRPTQDYSQYAVQQANENNIDVYRQQPQQQKYSFREEVYRTPSSTVAPGAESSEQSELPDVNPLELAINEFELHQINDQVEEHTKVKHSTTRRPQVAYENDQSVSNTRNPQSRGRHTYENEPTTESSVTRGRIRGRGRGTVSRTTSTTTTTAAPIEADRYTVLEQFVAREHASTESYRKASTEAETEPPRRTTTPYSGNPYLPEHNNYRDRPDIIATRQQVFDDTRSQIPFEPPKIETAEPELLQPQKPSNVKIENIPVNTYSLGQLQTYGNIGYDRPVTPQVSTRLVYENIEAGKNANTDVERHRLESEAPSHVHRFSPEVVSYENREPIQHRPSYQQYEEPDRQQLFQTETYERPPTRIHEPVREEQKPKQSTEDPSSFIENLFQPNYDQTYISLQDQAVRSLLVPNLLAPSAKQDSAPLSTNIANEEVVSSTEPIVEAPSSTEADPITTTTTRASRTRGRGRTRLPTTESTVTVGSRTSSNRRRPVSRTSTERISPNTDYSGLEDNGRSGSNVKQRFRTRVRPNQNEISERVSTTENDIRSFAEPVSEGNFDTSNRRDPSQSYLQFEHAIDNQQIITINPNLNQDLEIKEYSKIYNLPQQTTTENQQRYFEYDNTKPRPTPIMDVQVTHVVPEINEHRTQTAEEEPYIKYNRADIKSGGVLNNNNNKQELTTQASASRTRGRTRGRSRFSISTTTPEPVTRIVTRPTSSATRTTTEKEEQEFYGFTRQPHFTQSNLNIQATNHNPSTVRNVQPSVQFVGEIRPKYSPRPTTTEPTEELEAVETPRPRIRARTRAPARKTTNNNRQSDNDEHNDRGNEHVTRRTGTVTARTRGRGSTHYRVPENVKRESDEEDVANQNYPASFLQKLDASSSRTTRPFQITIDPLDDQTPYSSINRPKFLPRPDGFTDPNGLSSGEKVVSFKSVDISDSPSTDNPQTSKEAQALALVHTTQNSEEGEVELGKFENSPTEQIMTTLNPTEPPVQTKKSRRRGVWKLVKHKPLDPLEVSESQNYQTVLNAFDSIEKSSPYSKNVGGKFSNQGSLNNFQQETDGLGNENPQENIEDVVTVSNNTENLNAEIVTEIGVEDIITTTPSTTKTQENIFDKIYEMFGIFDTPEKKSNESSSSETSNGNIPTTTLAVPTFPEEITEIPTTTSTEKNDKASGEENIETQGSNDDDDAESITGTTESVVSATTEIKPSTKPYEVEPWEMHKIKTSTSTSTEVSHETEICYKGRCVKSKERKKHK